MEPLFISLNILELLVSDPLQFDDYYKPKTVLDDSNQQKLVIAPKTLLYQSERKRVDDSGIGGKRTFEIKNHEMFELLTTSYTNLKLYLVL